MKQILFIIHFHTRRMICMKRTNRISFTYIYSIVIHYIYNIDII